MSTRDPILMPVFAVAALLAACQAPTATTDPGVAQPVMDPPAVQAPAAQPAAPASVAPAPPADTSEPAVSREAALAKAKAAGIAKASFVALVQAENHELVHKTPTANRVWVIRDATQKSVCIDATTGAKLDK